MASPLQVYFAAKIYLQSSDIKKKNKKQNQQPNTTIRNYVQYAKNEVVSLEAPAQKRALNNCPFYDQKNIKKPFTSLESKQLRLSHPPPMATAEVAESRKLPRPGRGGVVSHNLTEEEARVKAIAEIVNNMVDQSRRGDTVNLNALKSAACRKYGLSRAPKLVEMIAALPESERESLLPKLKAKPVRTASGIAVVAVMSKPHRCPHIATTGNICVYCPGGPDSDFEYSTQSYTGYEPTSMRAIRARLGFVC